MNNANLKTSSSLPLSTAAIAALQRGNKIEAIKIVREERKIGLKEAKDAVDNYLQGQPALQSTLARAQAETKRSALRWLFALALGLLAAYFLGKR